MAIATKKHFRYKLYVTCDDSLQMSMDYSKERSWIRKFVINHIDGMLVVNDSVKIYLEEKFPKASCNFIYFPIIQDDDVLLEKFNKSSNIAKTYISRYRLGGKTVFMYVGRLVQCKNISLLIQAYAKVSSDNNILVVVGDGILKNDIEKLVMKLSLQNKVIFTGALSGPELYAWYYLANIHILPSKKEPFGAVVNEALVAGCWSIVSDHVGASSLIENGKNGYVFKSDNVNDLVMKLKSAMERVGTKKNHKDLMINTFDDFYSSLTTNFEE